MTNSFTTVAANGCTADGCGTQRTVVLSARDGRRCAAHADHLPDEYRADLAMDLVDAGHPSTAFAWLRRALDGRTR